MKNMKKLILMAAFGLFVHQNIGATDTPVTDTPVNITIVGAPAGYIVQTHKCIQHGNGGCSEWTTPATVNPTAGGNTYSINTSAGAEVQYLIMLNGGQVAYEAPAHFAGKTTWTLSPNPVTYSGTLS